MTSLDLNPSAAVVPPFLLDFNDVEPERVRYDLDEIVARLRDTAASWVPRLFPNGRRNESEWRLANIRGDAPRKMGSCVIQLAGEHAGDWFDFDGNDGGGPLSALERATGLSGRELFAYASDLVDWKGDVRPVKVAPPASSRSREQDSAREIEFILSRTVALPGTAAAAYLAARGLKVPDCPDLLSHPDVTYWETKTGWPALIGVVRDVAGERVAIQRTYLRLDGSDKADVPKPRKMLGQTARGAVRLADPAERLLGLAEGIETGLAVMQACPALPVWATLSASNLEQVQLPADVKRVVILADHDASGAGSRAAETAALRLHAEGRKVWIALPPREGDDFNDLLRREGPNAVQAALDGATRWGGEETGEEDPVPVNIGTHRPVGFVPGEGKLPRARADEGNLAKSAGRAWSLLLGSNTPAWLFRSAGDPIWVVRDDEGLPMPRPLTEERLRLILAQLADWVCAAGNGEFVPAHPPTGTIKSILATPDPDLPVLAGIVTTPVFGRGGDLVTRPGYHPGSRLLYDPPKGFSLPDIPASPTAEQISAARALIVDELLGDFPFTSRAERAHAVALLLLPFARQMVDGPTPLHMIEKPTPGTGATLLVDAVSIIATGFGAGVMTEATDDDEWRKRITAKLRQLPAIVVIDNLRHTLDSSSLAAALTATYWEDRLLGISETTRLPIRCAWIATGNNPDLSAEMTRRIVRIRLDAHMDQPALRSGFRHPGLTSWIKANRSKLVAACLTLIRAWIAAGKPAHARTIGSFESWAQTLGGILDVAGIPGFLGNLEEVMASSDSETSVWRGFIALWWNRYGTAEVGTMDLHDLATECEPPLPLGDGNDRSRRTRLGRALGKMRDCVYDIDGMPLRVRAAGIFHQAKRWQLVIEPVPGPRAPQPGKTTHAVENTGSGERGERYPETPASIPARGERADGEAQRSPQRSPIQPIENQSSGERGELGERSSYPYACAGAHTLMHAPAHTHVRREDEQRSPSSPRSQNPATPDACTGERGGERAKPCSPAAGTVPQAWLDGIDAVFRAPPPRLFSQRRWFGLRGDLDNLIREGWIAKAASLGWSEADLFGCDANAPTARLDRAGLALLLQGDAVVAMDEASATLRTRTGSLQTFRRKPASSGAVAVWTLIENPPALVGRPGAGNPGDGGVPGSSPPSPSPRDPGGDPHGSRHSAHS